MQMWWPILISVTIVASENNPVFLSGSSPIVEPASLVLVSPPLKNPLLWGC